MYGSSYKLTKKSGFHVLTLVSDQLNFILWRMNLLVFSLMSKANVTNSKYRWFSLHEVELFGSDVFTSRSISDILSSS